METYSNENRQFITLARHEIFEFVQYHEICQVPSICCSCHKTTYSVMNSTTAIKCQIPVHTNWTVNKETNLHITKLPHHKQHCLHQLYCPALTVGQNQEKLFSVPSLLTAARLCACSFRKISGAFVRNRSELFM